MDFVDIVGAQPNTVVVSDPMIISGVAAGAVPASIIGGVGEFSVNGAAWTTAGYVQVGDSVRLRVTTPAGTAGESVEVTLSVTTYGYILWSVTNINDLSVDVVAAQDSVESAKVHSGFLPQEVATASIDLFARAFIVLDDEAAAGDTALPTATLRLTVESAAVSTSKAMPVVGLTVTETADVSDQYLVNASLRLTSAGVATDVALGRLTAIHMVTETATAKSTVSQAKHALLTSTGVASSDVVLNSPVYLLLVDEAGASSTVILDVRQREVVDETGVAIDWQRTVAQLSYYVNGGRVEASDEYVYLDPTHGAWVAALPDLALTRWEDLPYRQIHQHGGTLYGIDASGVYVIGGSGVDAELVTGVMDFKVDKVKSLEVAYVTALSDSPLELDAVRASAGGAKVTTYRPATGSVNVPSQARIKFGQGRSSRYWGFAIRNTNGDKLTISDLRIVPVVGDRRI